MNPYLDNAIFSSFQKTYLLKYQDFQMTGVRDDGDCDDYDDSSLEFLYSRTLDKSAILFALFEYLSEVFFYFCCYLRVL